MKSPHLRLFLNISTLHALVIAKPVFDVFSNYPEYFVANRVYRSDIVWFVLFVSFVIPAMIATPLALIQHVAKKRGAQVHLIAIGGYGFGYMLQLIAGIDPLPLFLMIVLGAAAGIGMAVLYWRNTRFPFIVSLVSPIVLLFPLLFLFDGNMQQVLFPQTISKDEPRIAVPKTIDSTPPIVMVVFDEFPLTDMLDAQGGIDSKRFPRFADFTGVSTWYENATTVRPFTAGAVPAILTGKRPDIPAITTDLTSISRQGESIRKSLPTYENFPENLFSMLRDHYTFNIHEATTNMVPPHVDAGGIDSIVKRTPLRVLLNDASIVFLHVLLPEKLTNEIPRIDQGWGHFGKKGADKSVSLQNVEDTEGHNAGASFQVSTFRTFVQSLDTYPESTLHFLHIVHPHSPHVHLPSGKTYSRDNREIGIEQRKPVWKGSDRAVATVHQAFKLQAASTDTFLGTLLDSLKANGWYDESFVIITADHGASFYNGHPHRVPTQHTFGDIAFVPLFIKYPNQTEGKMDSSNVESIDILPTIRDVIGAELNWRFDGRSLVDHAVQPRETKMLADSLGNDLELTRREYLDAKEAALNRNIVTFSLDDPRSDLFRFGKGLEFIGQPESVLYSKRIESDIQCKGLDALRNVDLNSEVLNLRLVGNVTSVKGVPSDYCLVFSINGTIELFSKPMQVDNQYLFDVILPEHVFIQGKNTVRALLVDLDTDSPSQP
jgi:hypothetical protein